MQRANLFRIEPNKTQGKILKEIMEHTAYLYNIANYEKRQKFFAKEKLPTAYDLDKQLKDNEHWKIIGTGVAHQTISKLENSWSTFWANLKRVIKEGKEERVKIPRYNKNRKTGKPEKLSAYWRNDCYTLRNDKLCVSVSRATRKKYGLQGMLEIPIKGNQKWRGKQGNLQISYSNGKFYCIRNVKTKEPEPVKGKKICAIDLGVINLATLKFNKESVIYKGANLLSDFQYHDKIISEEQEKLAKNHKSKLKYSKKIGKLKQRQSKRHKNALKSLAKAVVRECKERDVGRIYIGDIRKIRENCNFNGNANQKIHNFWAFGYLLSRLECCAENVGIAVDFVSEENTSKTCPVCGFSSYSNRKYRGLFVCKHCAYTENADVVGATNIYKKVAPSPMDRGSGLETQPFIYHWEESKWTK